MFGNICVPDTDCNLGLCQSSMLILNNLLVHVQYGCNSCTNLNPDNVNIFRWAVYTNLPPYKDKRPLNELCLAICQFLKSNSIFKIAGAHCKVAVTFVQELYSTAWNCVCRRFTKSHKRIKKNESLCIGVNLIKLLLPK